MLTRDTQIEVYYFRDIYIILYTYLFLLLTFLLNPLNHTYLKNISFKVRWDLEGSCIRFILTPSRSREMNSISRSWEKLILSLRPC